MWFVKMKTYFLVLYFIIPSCNQTCGESHFLASIGFSDWLIAVEICRHSDSPQSVAKHPVCIIPTRSGCCGKPIMREELPLHNRGQVWLVSLHATDRWFSQSTLTGGNYPFSDTFSGLITRWTHGIKPKPKDLGNLPSGCWEISLWSFCLSFSLLFLTSQGAISEITAFMTILIRAGVIRYYLYEDEETNLRSSLISMILIKAIRQKWILSILYWYSLSLARFSLCVWRWKEDISSW